MDNNKSELKTELSTGELARRAECKVASVRYYERIGLLPEPPRGLNGRRRYSEDHFKRLSFIRRCRGLGFTLDQVRKFLSYVDNSNYTCADIKPLIVAHEQEVNNKIVDLKKMGAALHDMSAMCDGGEVPNCMIIDVLFGTNKS